MAAFLPGAFLTAAEDQFVIAGFGVLLHVDSLAGQFGDHQFTGGVDDAAGAEVAADGGKIRKICDLTEPVRLVITLGYAKEGDPLRPKKRKALSELAAYRE